MDSSLVQISWVRLTPESAPAKRPDLLQRGEEKGPRALRVEPQIGAVGVRGERRVGMGPLGDKLALAVENDELEVGLAEIEHRDAAGHARPPLIRPAAPATFSRKREKGFAPSPA